MIIIEIYSEKKLLKVPIDAGFDCPNQDGTVAHGAVLLYGFWFWRRNRCS